MNIPRRNQMQAWCPAEHRIYEAMQAVEEMAADVRLTDAVVLLGAARDRVADFIDGVEGKRTVPSGVRDPSPPEPKAFCTQCGFPQMDATRIPDGANIPAPWQVTQCGDAWSDVYHAAFAAVWSWLMEEHATPKLSRHLQTLSTALTKLDQKRIAIAAPLADDLFTWKQRAEKAEAELAGVRGAGVVPPEEPK